MRDWIYLPPGRRLTTPLTTAEYQEISCLYQQGQTLQQIAGWVGVSAFTIRETLIFCGIPLRKRGRRASRVSDTGNDHAARSRHPHPDS
jgi:hypothetical protein